ncbi:peptidoglycan editing factor PgeF [Peptostreptococcus sp. D1]|uniref:peptidoglycan editing factor PgeF n=1 Tax=Peptostreptococcus sp. D1 TaxID=72304 RepID=UPI0008E1FA18|nr:peptidoglycan editing factor PgeF [Peptostreptococcus sp. D1]SFE16909.1 conserved hypothetical protein [Peptostreptococcus sp. D1]
MKSSSIIKCGFLDLFSSGEYDSSKYLYSYIDGVSVAITKRKYDAKNDADMKIVCDELGFNFEKLTYNNQIHSSIIRKIDESNISEIKDADALITDLRNVPLVVFTADCAPVVIIDEKNSVGIAHAGWRGSYGNIAVKTIDEMVNNYNSKASSLKVIIGPCISEGSYNVGYELIEKFSLMLEENGINVDEGNKFYSEIDGVYYLNLVQVNKLLLINRGVNPENILEANICTALDDDFYSYRKDSRTSKRIGTIVEIREEV